MASGPVGIGVPLQRGTRGRGELRQGGKASDNPWRGRACRRRTRRPGESASSSKAGRRPATDRHAVDQARVGCPFWRRWQRPRAWASHPRQAH
eukprot:3228237-Pleurochrysis_carterae.AAC.1